jgi:hypothetical protein
VVPSNRESNLRQLPNAKLAKSVRNVSLALSRYSLFIHQSSFEFCCLSEEMYRKSNNKEMNRGEAAVTKKTVNSVSTSLGSLEGTDKFYHLRVASFA